MAAIAQLIEGEPFLCPPPAAAAYVAQLLAAIDPDFPLEVIPLLEEHDPPARHCPHCAAEEGRILAALEWEGS